MNRTYRLIGLTAALGLALAACAAPPAQPAAPAQPAQPAQPAATQPAAPAPAAEIVLRWRTRPDNKEEADVYASISDEVAKKLGIKLVYEPGGSETASYQDVLRTELAAGTAPDVFWIPGTDIADFVQRGLLLDLRPYAAKTEGYSDANYYPEPMFHLTYNPETGKSGEKLWGLPRDVSTFVLYLNLDLINEAGAPDPRELAKAGKWDWDAFKQVAEKVNALGGDIKGYGMNAWWGPFGAFMNAAGGGFFNAERNACNLNSKETLTGLAFLRELYDAGLAVPYGEDSEPPFRAGKVGMFQNGRWATPGISTVTFNWDVVELPKGPSGHMGNWLFWGAYVVNKNTKHPEEAWKLVDALTQPDIQAKVAARGTNIPSRVGEAVFAEFLKILPEKNNQAFLNGLADKPTAEGPLWTGSWPDFDRVMGAQVSDVLTGKLSVEQFGQTVCDEANKAFNK